MSIVVSDTSPILNLDRVGQLDLLPKLYGSVIIPPAVHQELLTNSRLHFDLRRLTWIEVRAPQDRRRIEELMVELDPGEAEAIALSIEIGADLLLVDEKMARRIATERGLTPTGLLGVLIEAKARGLIQKVRPVMDDLIRIAGFWISAELHQQVLSKVGEI